MAQNRSNSECCGELSLYHTQIERIVCNLRCSICLDVPMLPVSIICFPGCSGTRGKANQTCLRNSICQHCANDMLQLDRHPTDRFPESKGQARCLICRETSIDTHRLGLPAAYHVIHSLMDVMDGLGMGAECRKCNEDLGTQASLQEHYQKECPFAVIQCRYRGCTHAVIRSSLPMHEAVCKVGRTCCLQCNTFIDKEDIISHMVTSCRHRIVSCIICKHKARLPSMLTHLRSHQKVIQIQIADELRSRVRDHRQGHRRESAIPSVPVAQSLLRGPSEDNNHHPLSTADHSSSGRAPPSQPQMEGVPTQQQQRFQLSSASVVEGSGFTSQRLLMMRNMLQALSQRIRQRHRNDHARRSEGDLSSESSLSSSQPPPTEATVPERDDGETAGDVFRADDLEESPQGTSSDPAPSVSSEAAGDATVLSQLAKNGDPFSLLCHHWASDTPSDKSDLVVTIDRSLLRGQSNPLEGYAMEHFNHSASEAMIEDGFRGAEIEVAGDDGLRQAPGSSSDLLDQTLMDAILDSFCSSERLTCSHFGVEDGVDSEATALSGEEESQHELDSLKHGYTSGSSSEDRVLYDFVERGSLRAAAKGEYNGLGTDEKIFGTAETTASALLPSQVRSPFPPSATSSSAYLHQTFDPRGDHLCLSDDATTMTINQMALQGVRSRGVPLFCEPERRMQQRLRLSLSDSSALEAKRLEMAGTSQAAGAVFLRI